MSLSEGKNIHYSIGAKFLGERDKSAVHIVFGDGFDGFVPELIDPELDATKRTGAVLARGYPGLRKLSKGSHFDLRSSLIDQYPKSGDLCLPWLVRFQRNQ